MGVVPCLDEGRDQLTKRFTKRDTTSDGAWGNKAHQTTTSSHNGDKSGKAEHKDGDKKDEVRARDFDADLRDPYATMEDVVQHWVKALRAGKMKWIRYIIFNGRIWHRKDNFKTRKYTGKNKHTLHAHVNSEFNQWADEVTGTDWLLKDFKKPKPAPPAPSKPTAPPKPPAIKIIKLDGKLDTVTVKRWQEVMGVTQSGKLSSDFVKVFQRRLKATVDHRIVVDGKMGPKTIAGLQRYLKSPVDGVISKPRSEMVLALQRRLNTGKF